MKTRVLTIIMVVVITITFSESCRNSTGESESRNITVSILPFKFFVSRIAGPDYFVNVIVPPGASPATFEPPPSVINNLRNSDVVIFNRYLGFEEAWMDKLMQVNPGINSLFLADNQKLIAAEEHQHGDHIHLSGVDPHFWVSPSAALIISKDIFEFLSSVYPDDKDLFSENYNDLVLEIENVRDSIHLTLSGIERRTFLIFHPALTYFAEEFNLIQVPIELEGKEPTASWLMHVIDLSRSKGISTILVQQEFNKKSAETIAKEIDGTVVEIFPLSDDWIGSIYEIADALVAGNK